MQLFRDIPLVEQGQTGISTIYREIDMGAESLLGIFAWWDDNTSAATFSLESTLLPASVAPTDSTNASHWAPEAGVTITGPTATAQGASSTSVGNLALRRYRVKIEVTAVWTGGMRAHVKA